MVLFGAVLDDGVFETLFEFALTALVFSGTLVVCVSVPPLVGDCCVGGCCVDVTFSEWSRVTIHAIKDSGSGHHNDNRK